MSRRRTNIKVKTLRIGVRKVVCSCNQASLKIDQSLKRTKNCGDIKAVLLKAIKNHSFHYTLKSSFSSFIHSFIISFLFYLCENHFGLIDCFVI